MADNAANIPFRLTDQGSPRRRPGGFSTSMPLLVALAVTTLLVACATTSPAASGGRPSPPVTPPEGLNVASLAVTPAGDLLISQFRDYIVSRSASGAIHVVAGTGRAGYSGDGGPATQAQLNQPQGLAVGADGTIYFVDVQNNRVRAISAPGTITTTAGDGLVGSAGVGGPATAAELYGPQDVAVAPDGRVYVSVDEDIDEIADGTLRIAVHGGPGSLGVTRTSEAKDSNGCGPTCPLFPGAIAFDKAGDLFAADTSPKVLVEFSPTLKIINAWTAYDVALASAPDGSVVAADYGSYSLDRISNGAVTPIATFKMGSPFKGTIFRPSSVAVAPDGDIYTSDGAHLLLVTPSGTVKVLGT
jgi:sugar lactone lactonase YvrE